MAIDIGATGSVGIAFESTPGTYVAPTKFFPILSENVAATQSTIQRRSIRQLADVIGAVQGDQMVGGDITMEALHDVVPYFLHASRNTFVKTGVGPFVYTYTPTHGASAPNAATRTLSITIVRNVAGGPVIFGYSGCIVTKQSWSLASGLLQVVFSVIGTSEASQSAPTVSYANGVPMSMGMYSVEIPTASPVTDTDTFTFDVDDAGAAAFRMRSGGVRSPTFVWMGQRSVSMGLVRDFATRADYDAFKALTAQSITVSATNGTNIISLKVPAIIKDTYEVGLTGQGDLVRATIKYFGTYDTGTSKSYEWTITTSESIT